MIRKDKRIKEFCYTATKRSARIKVKRQKSKYFRTLSKKVIQSEITNE
ncbi:MAG: hypothetical protein QXV17_05010 [Candidatus Micrarchaeaceae archaeon]